MTLYGNINNGTVMLTLDETVGMEIHDAITPVTPAGYKATPSFIEQNGHIWKVYTLEPIEGTAENASLALAKLQASKLSDVDALEVIALFDEWKAAAPYKAGERVKYLGLLYKCAEEHTSVAGETPDVSDKWAQIVATAEVSEE